MNGVMFVSAIGTPRVNVGLILWSKNALSSLEPSSFPIKRYILIGTLSLGYNRRTQLQFISIIVKEEGCVLTSEMNSQNRYC